MRFNAGANLELLVVFALIKRILLLNGRVRQVDAATKQVTIVHGHRYTGVIIIHKLDSNELLQCKWHVRDRGAQFKESCAPV